MSSPFAMHRKLRQRQNLVQRAAIAAGASVFEKLEDRRLMSLSTLLPEFLVNSDTANAQIQPAIAMDADGDFIIAWTGYYGPGGVDYMDGVYLRRYKANGDALGTEFLVNTYTLGHQNDVSLAMAPGGNFVVVWTSEGQDGSGKGIFAQRFNPSGAAQGSEFQVNTFTTGDQFDSSVAMDAFGNFVITWTSTGQDGEGNGIFAQRFSAGGAAIGSEIAVNTYTSSNQQGAKVALDDAGDFVVVWESYLQESEGTDFSSGLGVYAQRYASDGTPMGSEFQINTSTIGDQRSPVIAMDGSGNFIVAFQGFDADGEGINLRRFNSNGVAQDAGDVQVNITTSGAQIAPSIAMDGVGNFMVSWTGPDINGTGVWAQFHNAAGVKIGSQIAVNENVNNDQHSPVIAASDDGTFGIAWVGVDKISLPVSPGIYAKLYEQDLPPPFPLNPNPATNINSFTTSTQERPAIAIDGQGEVIVVWQSLDEDGDGYGIFGQRYDAQGLALGLSFRINNTTVGDQTAPIVAASAAGGFVVVWQSADDDGLGVYGRLYNSAGQAVGDEFLVNTYITGHQALPDVAMNSAGDFVIAWQSFEQGGEGYEIYARRYSLTGAPTASEFHVNTYTTGAQAAPTVAADPTGKFVVAWQSAGQDGDGYGIYARRYEADTDPLGTEFQVHTFTTSHQFDPDIAMDPEGNFVVVWNSLDQFGAGVASIHFQRYDGVGLAQGSETRVDVGATADGASPSVAMDGAGNFVVAWQVGDDGQDGDGDKAGIRAQRFNGDGTFRGSGFAVNTFTTANQTTPAIASNLAGDIAIVWTDEFGDDLTDEAIVGRRFARLSSTIVAGGQVFPINTYTIGDQFNSSVAIDDDGDIIVVWQSADQPGEVGLGIYGQRFDAEGNRIGSEFHVNTITLGAQQNPVVAWGPNGTFLIAWQSSQFPGGDFTDVVVRRYDAQGNPLGTEFMVNTYVTHVQADPSVAIDADGDFVVAWRSFAQDGLNYGIYAQRFLADGTANGSEFVVNTYTTGSQNFPVVAMDDAGNFVIAWQSFNQADPASGFDIYARWFDLDGNASSNEFLVNTYTTGAQANVSIAMNSAGQFIIAWDSVNQLANGPVVFSGLDIFARLYTNTRDLNGVPIAASGAFQVNSYTSSEQRLPAVAMDNSGNFVVAWASRFQDGDAYGIYSQRYNPAGVGVGGEVQVNVVTSASQFSPAVAMDSDGDIIVTWQSGGNQDGSQYGVFGRRYRLGGINPLVLSKNFIWQTGPQRLEFVVDRDVSASLGTDDLELVNLSTNQTLTPADLNVTFVVSSNKIIFTFPTSPNGGALLNGRYRARLKGSQITDTSGNSIGADQIVEFYFINGDANHDGFVNLYDLVALATRWQQPSGTNYAFGDFNYDGTVNATDLAILAQNWQVSLASLAPALPAAPTAATLPPAAEAAQQEPPPAAPPVRAPVRTPTRVAAATTTPAPAPEPAAPAVQTSVSIIPQSAPAPVVVAQPAPQVEPEITPLPTPVAAVVTSSTPAASPISVVEQDTQPSTEQMQVPVKANATSPTASETPTPAPVSQPTTSPFANGPVVQSEAQAPPRRRTPARSPVRTASLVDL